MYFICVFYELNESLHWMKVSIPTFQRTCHVFHLVFKRKLFSKRKISFKFYFETQNEWTDQDEVNMDERKERKRRESAEKYTTNETKVKKQEEKLAIFETMNKKMTRMAIGCSRRLKKKIKE